MQVGQREYVGYRSSSSSSRMPCILIMLKVEAPGTHAAQLHPHTAVLLCTAVQFLYVPYSSPAPAPKHLELRMPMAEPSGSSTYRTGPPG